MDVIPIALDWRTVLKHEDGNVSDSLAMFTLRQMFY